MRNGICPKCQGQEIYQVSPGGAQGTIGLGMFDSVPLTYLICTTCGYTESHILALSLLPKVKKHGRRFTGEDS
jgi:hypothetical protein